MKRAFRSILSHFVGWLADRRIPGPFRRFVYGTYSRLTGADPDEAQLGLEHYPSLGAFFVRRLRDGARPLDPAPDALVSPCDGCIQAADPITGAMLLQAKGMSYAVATLLGGAGDEKELEGGFAWTIYLSPRDYHRVHTPLAADLQRVVWIPGDRFSVAPKVLARRPQVFASNERAVLEMKSELGTYYLVMVGALNVGRIRVVGVDPGASPASGPGTNKPHFARGAELARFEMGSTVILLFPPGMVNVELMASETKLLLGQRLGTLSPGPVGSHAG